MTQEAKKVMFSRVGLKLVIPFLIIFIFILIFIMGIIYYSYKVQVDSSYKIQEEISQKASSEINFYMESIKKDLNSVSRSIVCIECNKENNNEVLKNIIDTNPSIYEISIINNKGDEVSKIIRYNPKASLDLKSVSTEDKFKKALGGDFYLGSVYISNYQIPFVSISIPIKDRNNTIIGVLATEVELSPMWGTISKIEVMKTGYVYVVDRNGILIAYKDINKVKQNINLKDSPGVNNFFIGIHSNKAYTSFTNIKVIGNWEEILSTHWGVIVELPVKELSDGLMILVYIGILSVVLFVVCTVFFLSRVSISLTRPIMNLRDTTLEISKGNFSIKSNIETKDEIGELAYTFNQMTQDIKKSRDELENYSKNLEKKVEERTKELESKNEELEKFDKIFQNLLDGIVVADAKTGIILDCNPAACELVGRQKSELIGKHQSILHPKKVKGEDSNTFQDHLHEKEGNVLETKVITKDGKIKDVAIKANVFEFGGKKLIHGVFRDITDKKDYEDRIVRINKRLEEANQKLKNLDQQKDEFISLSAHELKTPLTSIRGFAQLMNNDAILKNKEKSKHFLSLIDENTQRLYNLIVDLVDSSRISLGKFKLNIEDVDAYKLYNDIKENMSPAIKEKGLTGEFSIEKGLPKIKADSERIMQVIRNLITNSIKFTGKGTISLKVYKKGKLVQFEVKDTGQGIPEANKRFLFSKFYQVDSSMTRKVGGSGLGLSICKGLVESMGGKIWFTSEEGKGSTFYFTMPIAK
ncbi:MAG: ATP-binding protein [archaeon]